MKRYLFLLIYLAVVFGYDMTYELSAGWNMISLPCETEATDLSEIFPLLPPAYTYNAETMSYEALEGLPEQNQGLFMLFMSDTTVTIECSRTEPDTLSDDNSFCMGLKLGTSIDSMRISTSWDGGFLLSVRSIIGIDPTPMRLVARLSSELDIEWIKRIDYIEGTEITSSGENVFIAGKLYALSSEIYVSKLSREGHEIWTTVLMEPSYLEIIASCATSDGGFALLTRIAMIKLDSDGGLDYSINIGMTGEDIFENEAGNINITGDLILGLESPPLTIVEIDPSGDLVAVNAINGFPYYRYSASCYLSDGGIIAVGSAVEDSAVIFTRLSPEMTPLWSKKTNLSGRVGSVKEIYAETYAIAGKCGNNALSMIVDDDEIVSANVYGVDYIEANDDEMFSECFSFGGGILFFGSKKNYGLEEQSFMVHTDVMGNSCCSTPVAASYESFVTLPYIVEISLTEITPMVRDTVLVLDSAEGLQVFPLCPR